MDVPSMALLPELIVSLGFPGETRYWAQLSEVGSASALGLLTMESTGRLTVLERPVGEAAQGSEFPVPLEQEASEIHSAGIRPTGSALMAPALRAFRFSQCGRWLCASERPVGGGGWTAWLDAAEFLPTLSS